MKTSIQLLLLLVPLGSQMEGDRISSGAIFIPDTAVVLSKANTRVWVFIPIPEKSNLDEAKVQELFEGQWTEMHSVCDGFSDTNARWRKSDDIPQDHRGQDFSRLSGDYKLTAEWTDAQRKMIFVVTHQIQVTRSVRRNTIKLAAIMVNHTEPCVVAAGSILGPTVSGCCSCVDLTAGAAGRRLQNIVVCAKITQPR